MPRSHMHRNKQHRYSITSSARSRIDVGSSTPIALAVLRLTTSSNLFGCSTRQVGGFAAAQDLGDMTGGLLVHRNDIRAVRHQDAEFGIAAKNEHGRQAVMDCQTAHGLGMCCEEWSCESKQHLRAALGHPGIARTISLASFRRFERWQRGDATLLVQLGAAAVRLGERL